MTCNVDTLALAEAVSSPVHPEDIGCIFHQNHACEQIMWYHILFGEDGLT